MPLSWPALLHRLVAGADLTGAEASEAIGGILAGEASPALIASFVTALAAKRPTVEEMSGMLAMMFEHAEPLSIGGDLVDTCGTGGDGSMSINVSTMAALVAAGAGLRVCKHGGRGATSRCGSADVLEALGVVIDLGPEGVARCVREAGIGFCFAPRFHPAMRHASPVRRELGFPTVFNFLGPLANPARASRQVVGVSDPSMSDTMLGVLASRGARRAMVVYGDDGLDELSTTTTSTVKELEADGAGSVRTHTFKVDPTALGLVTCELAALRGGDAHANADTVRRVMGAERGPGRDIVVLNSAAALVVGGAVGDLAEGVGLAGATIDSGAAAGALDRLVETSQAAAAAEGR